MGNILNPADDNSFINLVEAKDTRIFVDKQTGVNYLYVNSGYSGGLTPLIDSDGKPIITPPEELENL